MSLSHSTTWYTRFRIWVNNKNLKKILIILGKCLCLSAILPPGIHGLGFGLIIKKNKKTINNTWVMFVSFSHSTTWYTVQDIGLSFFFKKIIIIIIIFLGNVYVFQPFYHLVYGLRFGFEGLGLTLNPSLPTCQSTKPLNLTP